jgi:hypothetical protein
LAGLTAGGFADGLGVADGALMFRLGVVFMAANQRARRRVVAAGRLEPFTCAAGYRFRIGRRAKTVPFVFVRVCSWFKKAWVPACAGMSEII